MPEAVYPKPINEVIETLAEIFRHQGRSGIVELLKVAHARFDQTDFDNWNGGTSTWALRLEVPVALFAELEPRITNIEKEIGSKFASFERLYPNDHLGEVTITPVLAGATARGERMAPSEKEMQRRWPTGLFRLFLSHSSENKAEVAALGAELAILGIEAFVAHEDIEPSLEWQNEIELALRSMHALVALITPDFHARRWTDQEIGWALGRGVLVIPVRMGADPYGFIGKYQGTPGAFSQTKALAKSIVNTLLAKEQTHGEMRRSLVRAFANSNSYITTQALSKLIVAIEDFSDDEKEALRSACENNKYVADAYYVPDVIYRAFGKPAKLKQAEASTEEPPF